MILTIFTPTYNRELHLKNLYQSLLEQSNTNFKWIIVDDGSKDNTERVVKSFIDENKIDITYYKQANGGKHIAHNKGVELCNTELFYCVDSDDLLPNDSVENILHSWERGVTLNDCIGIVGLKATKDGKISGHSLNYGVEASTLGDLYNIYGRSGETALIYKTKLLKKYPFPKFQNEKFISEEVVYDKLDQVGKLLIVDKVLYIMEYQDDGLTNNSARIWKASPLGGICALKSRYYVSLKLKGIKKYINIIRVLLVLGGFCISVDKSIMKNTPNKIISTILFLPSIIVAKTKYK